MKRQNIIVALLIAVVFFVGIVPIYPESALPLALFFVGVVIYAAAQERFPKFKQLVSRVYGVFLILFLIGGVLSFLYLLTLGEVTSDVVLILFVIITPLVILAVAVFYWGPVLNRFVSPAAAEQHYSNMIRLNKDFGYGYLMRAALRQNRGDREGALADYQRALDVAEEKAVQTTSRPFSINYDTVVIRSNRAMLYFQEGAFGDVIRECSAGLARPGLDKTGETVLRFSRAAGYLGNRDYEIALQELDEIARDREERLAQVLDLPLMAYRALALFGQGRESEARIAWENVIQREPNYQNENWLKQHLKWPAALTELAQKLNTVR